MKKILIILLLFSLVLSISCTDKKVNRHNKDKYLKLTEDITKDIFDNKFDSLKTNLSKMMIKKVKTDELIEVLKGVTNKNKLKKLDKKTVDYNEKNKIYITWINAITDREIIALNINYDLDYKIVGIFYKKKPLITKDNEIREIKLKVGKNKNLDALLTLPIKKGKYELVVLVQGSGPLDMHSTIGANKPFYDIANYLAKNNIATIRYNKRYYNNSKINEKVTIETEVIEDINSIIKNSINHEEIDKDRIFILGHSLGGMISHRIASENKEIKKIIIMAGSPRLFRDIVKDQNLNAIKKLSKKEQNKYIKTIEENYKKMKNYEDIGQITGKYIKSLDDSMIQNYLNKINLPMLIMQGKKDFQVSYEKDFLEYKKILKNKNAIFKEYDNLNHIFMKANNKSGIEAYSTPDKVDRKVLYDIVIFLRGEK